MASKASIHIEWTKGGQISYRTSGIDLPPPRADKSAWLLAPSPVLLLAHQCGVMRPTQALISCARVMDLLFHNRYLLMPINTALRSARIDFIYAASSAVRIEFHPKHSTFASNDSLEEGVVALINNYMQYVYSLLDEYLKLGFKTMAVAVIGHYFEFLDDQLEAGAIGKGSDYWSPSYPVMSASLIAAISEGYYIPQGGRSAENEKWARDQTTHLEVQRTMLESKRTSIFLAMGIY